MFEKIAEATPPAAAAKHVVTRVKEVNSGSAERTDPPLNPNQPNHRISTPAAAKGKLCPGSAYERFRQHRIFQYEHQEGR